MQFTTLLLTAATLIGVNAKVSLTNSNFQVTAGQPFTITWTDATGPVTLQLKNGAALNLQPVSTLTTGSTTTSYTWSVPSDIPVGNYAIEISDGSDTNYSTDFGIQGATASPSATTAASTSASASSTSVASVSSTSVTSVSSTSAASTSTGSSSTGSSTSSSASSSVTSSSNSTSSTLSSKTSSASKTSTAATSASASATTVPNSGTASDYASPLALVFLTVAAMFSLN